MNQHLMCSYQGHEKNKVKYICLDGKCLQNKLICSQCYIDKNHKHDNPNENMFDHIELQVQIQLSIDQLEQKLQQADDLFVQRSIALIRIIQLQMNDILDNLKQFYTKSYIRAKITNLQNKLEIIKQSKLNQVDDNFIKSMIDTDYQQNQQNILKVINQQCEQLMKNSVIMQKISAKEIQLQKFKDLKYEQTQLDQQSSADICSATISSDLRFVVTSKMDKVLKIWKYPNFELIQELKMFDQVFISKFTDDNNFLYIGTCHGLLCCYDAINDFRQIYKSKIHSNNSILNLFCISNSVVLTSSIDKQIIKTNTLLDQKLLVIQAHEDRIDGLDYNRSKDVIVSCSKDNSIKLWNNQNGSLLIKQQNAYQSIINQVLFINNNDQLITLDSNLNVNIWQIQYDTRVLQQINTINDQNIIFNISLVLNQQFILLICQEYMKFYTIQGQQVLQIKHGVQEFCKYTNLYRYDPLGLIKFIAINNNPRKRYLILYFLEEMQIFKINI